MMKKRIIISYLSLCTIAVLCAVLWRLEVNYHGWDGLTWIGYFHYAIPVGFIGFMVWSNLQLTITPRKRVLLNLVVFFYFYLVYTLLFSALTYFFAAGPTGLMLWLTDMYPFMAHLIFFIVPFTPVGTYFILKWFGFRTGGVPLAISVLVIALAIPVSVLILDIFNFRGSADLIHTVKSGVIIPFWVISVGILVISATGATKAKQE